MSINEIRCDKCGHTEWWEDGNYFGENTFFNHHWCGVPGYYKPCGSECDHMFPGASIWEQMSRKEYRI